MFKFTGIILPVKVNVRDTWPRSQENEEPQLSGTTSLAKKPFNALESRERENDRVCLVHRFRTFKFVVVNQRKPHG